MWVLLEKTKFGYELKATGLNKNAAKYCGMKEQRNVILTMMIAGGLAGFAAGIYFLTGIEQWMVQQTSVPAMGFNGIAAAFLGGLNPPRAPMTMMPSRPILMTPLCSEKHPPPWSWSGPSTWPRARTTCPPRSCTARRREGRQSDVHRLPLPEDHDRQGQEAEARHAVLEFPLADAGGDVDQTLLVILAAVAIGMLFSLLLGVAAIRFNADQTLVGTALNLLGPAAAVVLVFFAWPYMTVEDTLSVLSAMLMARTSTTAAAGPSRFRAVPTRVWSA